MKYIIMISLACTLSACSFAMFKPSRGDERIQKHCREIPADNSSDEDKWICLEP